MESQGVAGRVQVTEATRARLGDTFVFEEERGTIATKGMGEVRTWFLVARNSTSGGMSGGSCALRNRPSTKDWC